MQGFITLSKENSIESPPILTSEEPKTNLLCFNKNEVLIITLTSLSVSLSSDYYKDLLSFTFFNTNEKDKKTLTLKAIINIRDLDLIMDNFKIEGKNLSFQGTQTDFSAEIHELAFGSDYSIDSSIKLKSSLGIFSVSLKDFVFRYENFKNFQILSENFAVKGQKSCTPIKINIENCFLVVPVEKVFIIFLVSNAGIRTVLSQNVCFSLQIGTGRALMSKTNIENNENLDWKEIVYNESAIFASFSCVNLDFVYGNGFINDFCCFGVDCEKSFFEFFLGSNQENENFFAFECQLGCLVFHFCKDTIELLSENLHVFIEKNKKIEKKYEFEEIDEKYNEIKDKNKEIEDKNKEIEGIDAGSI